MVTKHSHEIETTENTASASSGTCKDDTIGFTADFHQYLNASAFALEKWLEQQYEESEKLLARRKKQMLSRKHEIDTASMELYELQQRDKEQSSVPSNYRADQSTIVEDEKKNDDNQNACDYSSSEDQLEQLNQIKSYLCSLIEEKRRRIEGTCGIGK